MILSQLKTHPFVLSFLTWVLCKPHSCISICLHFMFWWQSMLGGGCKGRERGRDSVLVASYWLPLCLLCLCEHHHRYCSDIYYGSRWIQSAVSPTVWELASLYFEIKLACCYCLQKIWVPGLSCLSSEFRDRQ